MPQVQSCQTEERQWAELPDMLLRGHKVMANPKDKVDEILVSIKRIREEKGISQRQLALAMGMDVSSWNKMENGQIGLKAPTIFKAADALDVDPAELLGRYSEGFNQVWELFQQLSPDRQDRIVAQLSDLADLESRQD